jgi:Caspase domain
MSAWTLPRSRWCARPGAMTVALLALVIAMVAHPVQARRLALVIGNDSYQHADRLNNARTDAKAVAAVLSATNFTVTLKQDLTLQAMKEALRTFKAQIAGGDEVVFYYSGHGVQLDGNNYLIPIDTAGQNADQIKDDSLSLQRVLDDMQDQKAKFTLAIIDACRDDPFKGNGRALRTRGLAPVTAATGQMVLYSAGAGQEALDNLGGGDKDPNGVFTRVLIKEMRKPGVPAEQVLKSVRDQVVQMAKSVHHEQVPALYDQSIGEFYFVAGNAVAAAAPTPSTVHVQTADEREQTYWDRIKDSTDPADFTDYKKQFPTGPHAAEAALMLRKLSRAPATTSSPTTVAAVTAPPGAATTPQAARSTKLVEAAAQGTWTLLVPNPQGVSTWYLDIRANGSYAFWATGPGAAAPHSGSASFVDGKWSTNSPSWTDGGTYQFPNSNTMMATGRLGTAAWQRKQ